MGKITRSLALGLALAFALPWPAVADMHGEHSAGTMGDSIAAADTPEENLELAAKYREMAANARDRAAGHREMAERYGKETKKGQMRRHCDRLAELNDDLAVEFEALAKAHEQEARGE